MQITLNAELRAQDADARARESHERGSPFQRSEIARRQMERAQDQFQAAMARIASMVAGGRSGGGGTSPTPSPSGGDDPNAFKMGTIRRRQGPTPVQARKKARIDD